MTEYACLWYQPHVSWCDLDQIVQHKVLTILSGKLVCQVVIYRTLPNLYVKRACSATQRCISFAMHTPPSILSCGIHARKLRAFFFYERRGGPTTDLPVFLLSIDRGACDSWCNETNRWWKFLVPTWDGGKVRVLKYLSFRSFFAYDFVRVFCVCMNPLTQHFPVHACSLLSM